MTPPRPPAARSDGQPNPREHTVLARLSDLTARFGPWRAAELMFGQHPPRWGPELEYAVPTPTRVALPRTLTVAQQRELIARRITRRRPLVRWWAR